MKSNSREKRGKNCLKKNICYTIKRIKIEWSGCLICFKKEMKYDGINQFAGKGGK